MRTESPEICIIGGGVAGALLAFHLATRGMTVLILEAGPWHDPAKRFQYMNESLYGKDPWVGDNPRRDVFTLEGQRRIYDLNKRRVKAVGGSGLHWGGLAERFHESDFELKTRYGIGIDWPISYKDLEPYYMAAEKLIGIAGADAYPLTPWRSETFPMPPFPFSYSDKLLKVGFDRLGIPLHHTAVARASIDYDGRPQCVSFSMCHACPIFAKWTPDLLIDKAVKTGNVIVKPKTRVIRINSSRTCKEVESVTSVSTINGVPIEETHRAQTFIITAHSVESARLLLLSSSSSHPNGLANSSGSVGKFLMEHPVVFAKAELKERTYPERIGFETAQTHHFYESSRHGGRNAFIMLLSNRHVQSPLDIVNEELSKRLIWGNELKNVVQRRFGFGVAIAAMIEQLPYETNAVTLDKEARDDLGFYAPRLTYYFNQKRELKTIEKTSGLLRKLLKEVDAQNVRLHIGLAPGHQMGTCRMGDDPTSSVVNRDLRAHDILNLYIVGSSVFPTCAAVTPTLTIAALALRLGDYLRGNLRHHS